jgi:hypothetical protein
MVAGWRTSRNELAGSIMYAFGDDDSPSLSVLDALTNSLEVAFDGTVTCTGSPFTSADEGTASPPAATPTDASAGPPPASDSPAPAPPRAEPAPLPPVNSTGPPTSTPLETLLGTYVSGNEDVEEVHPSTAPALQRAAPPPWTDGEPRPLRPSPTASTAPSAPAPAAAPTQIRKPRERLKLRKPIPSLGQHPGALHYPQLALVSTTAHNLSALDRHTGRARQRRSTPSPPRPTPTAPRAEPAPPAAPKPRFRWPDRQP